MKPQMPDLPPNQLGQGICGLWGRLLGASLLASQSITLVLWLGWMLQGHEEMLSTSVAAQGITLGLVVQMGLGLGLWHHLAISLRAGPREFLVFSHWLFPNAAIAKPAPPVSAAQPNPPSLLTLLGANSPAAHAPPAESPPASAQATASAPGSSGTHTESSTEDWFRLLADNVDHVFWVVELATPHRHLYISPSFETVFGLPCGQLYQDSSLFMRAVHPGDQPLVAAKLGHHAQTGQPFNEEFRILRPTGELRWLHSQAFALLDKAGRPYRSVGLAEDITERQQTTLALQASQAQLSDVLNNTLACIVQYRLHDDDRFTYDFWSKGAEAMFGFTAEEFMADGLLWYSRVLPEDIETVVRPIWQQVRTGKDFRIEYRFRHRDGSIRWVASATTSRRDGARSCWVCTVVDTDISDRKALETALQQSQNQLSAILNDASIGIASIRLGPDNIWESNYTSAGHDAIFGYTREAIQADKALWLSRVWPEDRAMFTGALLHDLRRGQPCTIEFRFRHSNGSWRWISSSHTSRYDREADCWAVVAVSQDITARKQAEDTLHCFERIVSATTDALSLIDRNYTYRLANQAYLQRFNYQLTDLVGKTVSDVLGAATFASLKDRFDRCLLGERLQFETWFEHPIVGEEFISVTYSPYREPDGAISGVVVSIRNLTDLKRAQAALQLSEARFQSLANNLPGVIYRYQVNPNGQDTFTYISLGSRELYELEPEAIVADATLPWALVHPDDRASIMSSIEQSMQTLTPWRWQGRILPPSGQTKWVQGIAKPERQTDGTLIWDGLLIDVTERQLAEAALRAERDLLNGVMHTSVAAIVVLSPEGQLLFANDQVEDILGLPTRELTSDLGSVHDSAGHRWRSLCLGEHFWLQQAEPVRQVIDTGATVFDGRHQIVRSDGQERLLSINGAPIIDGSGRTTSLVLTINDITEQFRAEMALRESEARLRLVAENMSDLVCLHQPDSTFVYVTPSCRTLLGYEPEELIGTNAYDFFHPDDRDRIRHESHTLVLQGQSTPTTYRMRCKSGQYIWLETLSNPILGPDNQVVQIQTSSRNVSDKIEIQSKLEHDALHDALTGLPNRSLLMERLSLALDRLQRYPQLNFAVLFLDLDRFKVINDSMGHQVGDDLLLAITQKLTALIRNIDVAARLSGDEFVVLLEEVEDVHDAVRIAERILAELQTPFTLQGREVFVSASIGIVISSPHYRQGDDVLRDADIAMYRAKANGKGCYALFDPQMHLQILHEMQLENALRLALEQQQFVLHYQPVVSLKTGCIEGFEALVRWQGPQGLISPQVFIPLAEETGLIVPLGNWILQEACRQLSQWQRRYPAAQKLMLSVNLSARQLKEPNLLEQLDAIFAETGLAPCCLTLEITESVLIEDIDHTIAVLGKMRSRGVRLSIDDFGTGYSSLSYLHRFPFTALKIDQSFVSQLGHQQENPGIVRTVVALADSLGLVAIAEGIETEQQLSFLQAISCEYGQGYWFSPGLSATAVEELLAQSLRLPLRDC